MRLEGVIPILPTPFDQEEAIVYADIGPLVDFAVESGATAVGVPAFGSEFYKLSGRERKRLIDVATESAQGRLPVIVQCNHTSPQVIADIVKEAEISGAAAINTALPRAFAPSEAAIVEYAQTVCQSTSLPVILQDWNPGGPTIGLDSIKQIHEVCENFSGIKYEESGIGPLIRQIETATEGKIRVFTGWGGMYLLELIPAGVSGAMPGFSLIDVFDHIWQAAVDGNMTKAYGLYSGIAPFVQFSLQNLEMFHHCEKRLLQRRGLLSNGKVRAVTITLNPDQENYLNLLIDRTLEVISSLK